MALFDIAAKDQSITYLTQIFGAVGTVLPIGDSTSVMLPVLFRWFNTVALVLGTLLVVYITVVGVLQSAHEGEFMGKKWSGLWVPLRMVFGIIALFPTSTGYCALQVIMMWIIVQGVGVADTLWTKALVVASNTGSPYGTVNTTAAVALQGEAGLMNRLFRALLCQAEAAMKQPAQFSSTQTKIYYCADNPNDTFCQSTANMLDVSTSNKNQVTESSSTHTYSMGPNGICGSLSYAVCQGDANSPCGATDPGNNVNGPSSLGCLTCKGRAAAMQSIVSVLGSIASLIASSDYEYYQLAAGTIIHIIITCSAQ